MTAPLFDLPPGTAPAPPPTGPVSADRARTQRQAAALTHGLHPLGLALRVHLPLHPEAAPAGDRAAPGRRCGTCAHRAPIGGHARSYPKCHFGAPARITKGAATDVRAHWPACRDHQSTTDTTGDTP